MATMFAIFSGPSEFDLYRSKARAEKGSRPVLHFMTYFGVVPVAVESVEPKDDAGTAWTVKGTVEKWGELFMSAVEGTFLPCSGVGSLDIL